MALDAATVVLEATVADNGDLVVQAAEARPLALVPGQRVRLRVVPAKRRRRSMLGALQGTTTPVTEADLAEARAAMWAGFPREPGG